MSLEEPVEKKRSLIQRVEQALVKRLMSSSPEVYRTIHKSYQVEGLKVSSIPKGALILVAHDQPSHPQQIPLKHFWRLGPQIADLFNDRKDETVWISKFRLSFNPERSEHVKKLEGLFMKGMSLVVNHIPLGDTYPNKKAIENAIKAEKTIVFIVTGGNAYNEIQPGAAWIAQLAQKNTREVILVRHHNGGLIGRDKIIISKYASPFQVIDVEKRVRVERIKSEESEAVLNDLAKKLGVVYVNPAGRRAQKEMGMLPDGTVSKKQ